MLVVCYGPNLLPMAYYSTTKSNVKYFTGKRIALISFEASSKSKAVKGNCRLFFMLAFCFLSNVFFFFYQLQINTISTQHYGTPSSWSSSNAFVSRAWGLRFNFWAGQIEHTIANNSPPLWHFFQRCCVAQEQWHREPEVGLANSLHTSA